MPAYSRILLPWDSQPQEVVEVDWGNPITRGLVFLAPMSGGQVHDIVGGKRATVTGSVGHGVTVDGVYGLLSGTQYYTYPNFGAELSDTMPCTIAWLQTPIASSAYSCIGTLAVSGTTAGFIVSYQHATVSGYRFATGIAGTSAIDWDVTSELGGMTNGRSDRFILRTSTNLFTTTKSDFTLFRGQKSWTGANASNFGGVTYANRIGALSTTPGDPWEGTIGPLAVWNRALTDEEALSYNGNPWQLFAPRSIWVPIAAAGGVITATTSLSAAIQAAQAATASVAAAVQSERTATASADAAIQIARTALATLDAAVQQARTGSTTLAAAVQAALSNSATLDAYIQAGYSVSASVGAAVQATGTGSASLAAAVQAPITGTATLAAAIQRALTATATLGAAVQASATATATIDAYIQAGTTASATVGAAIAIALSASSSLSAAIATARSASASLGAAIAVQISISAAMSAAVQASSVATASVGAYVFDDSAVILGSLVGSTRQVGANRVNVQNAVRSNRQTSRR